MYKTALLNVYFLLTKETKDTNFSRAACSLVEAVPRYRQSSRPQEAAVNSPTISEPTHKRG